MALKILPGATLKARFTSEELEAIQAATGKSYELVRGELYEVMPTSRRHGEAVLQIGRLLLNWNDQSDAGKVMGDSGYILERGPDTVRGPDISFVTKERLKPEDERGFPDMAPDLAVEVRSPNETWPELEQKAREYFAAGCRMVWFIEIDSFLEVLRPNGERRRLGLQDTVELEDVLPGFRCRVRDFFPGARGAKG